MKSNLRRFDSTKIRIMTPRQKLRTHKGVLTKAIVPRKTPTMVGRIKLEKRRKTSYGIPFRITWAESMKRFGKMSTAIAVRMSNSNAIVGVAIRGKPRPVAPLTKAASNRATPTRT